ncbi:MAG: hypothetical protein ABSH50_20980 [Bryobacteraceae bacterium]|jgi:hypothetical protein
MRVALQYTFAASKKDPLGAVMERIHRAFLDAGLDEPVIQFNFGDASVGGFVSSVDRVLRRHPELERFVTTASPGRGLPGNRRISNGPLSPAAGEAVPFSTLQAITAGVPRSFPFHSVAIHFHATPFDGLPPAPRRSAGMMPGILLADNWWVNGRQRSLTACVVLEAESGSKKLPAPAEAVAAVLAACGKVRRTVQIPLASETSAADPVQMVRTPQGILMPSANPEAAQAVKNVVSDYRSRMNEVVERAGLPHDLPAQGSEELRRTLGVTAGPMKPTLERAFGPMGYTCRGGSGTFTLRRRTAANLTAELSMDVGTWGHQVLAIFKVLGVGFKAALAIPVCARSVPMAQYPIGDAARWQKIVENLAAMVAELDRSFVPAVEAAAGPSPEWYQPES